MYRQTNKVLKNYRKAYTNRNNVSSQQNNDFVSPQDIPELRRVIEITDIDGVCPFLVLMNRLFLTPANLLIVL
jgi:hypothetical protein